MSDITEEQFRETFEKDLIEHGVEWAENIIKRLESTLAHESFQEIHEDENQSETRESIQMRIDVAKELLSLLTKEPYLEDKGE